jgi:sialate O-acetylesterase
MLSTNRGGGWVAVRGLLASFLTVAAMGSAAIANVTLPALFTDGMVLQRDLKVPIWGWADPGEKITITIPNQKLSAVADAEGRWKAVFEPLAAGGSMDLIVQGNNEIKVKDVQVGDVWICSGQSNMEWPVAETRDADLELPAANYPNIRLFTIGGVGRDKPQEKLEGKWEKCTSATAAQFSAVGYFFGRQLHQNVKVPIGLIDNAWGGSACEAWVRRDLLEANPTFKSVLDTSNAEVAEFEKLPGKNYDEKLAAYQKKATAAREAGKPDPPGTPWWANPITGQYRPANLYNARIAPLLPYGIRGVIWYQGESNVARAYAYDDLFPLMITSWREAWGQGDFPFLFVQLADFMQEQPEPSDSGWAELRATQTVTLDKVPHTGQAVIIDLGEANDIHPRNKQDVAKRLARLALAKAYKQKIAAESARYKSMYKQGDRILVRLNGVNGKLRTPDGKPVTGFAVAGSDRKWVWANAKIVSDTEVEVRSEKVRDPMAVRYAWADNPVCNLYDTAGLPVTPFRTDQWPGVSNPPKPATPTKPAEPAKKEEAKTATKKAA